MLKSLCIIVFYCIVILCDACSCLPKIYIATDSESTMFGLMFPKKSITKIKYEKIDNHVTIIAQISKAIKLKCINTATKNKIIRKYQIKKCGKFYIIKVYFSKNSQYLRTKCSSSAINICVLNTRTKRKILIDPGHGGRDFGAIAQGINEKELTIAFAKYMKQALEKTEKYEVHVTRADDSTITLSKRIDIITLYSPDVIISIHADNFSNNNIRGLAVYTYPKLPIKDPNNIDSVSSSIFRDDTFYSSTQLANKFLKYIPQICKISKNTRRTSKILILGRNIPSILIETGYISNIKDNMLLNSNLFKEKLAQSLVYSLDDFFMKD